QLPGLGAPGTAPPGAASAHGGHFRRAREPGGIAAGGWQLMGYLPDRMLDHLRQVAEMPDFSGTRYRVEEEIGRGGMGTVYRAWDAQLERAVALKVIDSATTEPKVLAQLEHPGLVPVYDAGELPDGRAYYAMRLVRGRRL